jgi:pimeloyl-ACP methyl ester carboxylesterase
MATTGPRTGYTPVNGLNLYYEIHGAGRPLVLLHGAFMSIDGFGPLLPALAKTRQVIGVELQGHGHTADIDRPLRYEQLADDTAALLRHLDFDQADLSGYSLGAGTALQVAIRHPDLVRKLVVVSGTYNSDGFYPGVLEGIQNLTPEVFSGTPWHETYLRVAPDPDAFPTLVAKVKEAEAQVQDWPPEDVRAIKAPTLVVLGDSEPIRPEHAVELFRLRGGGVPGDLVGLPPAQLAILPGTTHVGILERSDWLVSMITPFLDAPMPETG